MKKMIANYIDTSEGLAKGTLTFQERATAWAKNTPWTPSLLKYILPGQAVVHDEAFSLPQRIGFTAIFSRYNEVVDLALLPGPAGRKLGSYGSACQPDR